MSANLVSPEALLPKERRRSWERTVTRHTTRHVATTCDTFLGRRCWNGIGSANERSGRENGVQGEAHGEKERGGLVESLLIWQVK